MMDRFREGMNGPLAWVLLALVFIAFVFTGVGNFFVSGDADAVAKVDGEKITRMEFEQAYQRARSRYGEMYNQIFNTEEKEQDFRRSVLQNLVATTALNQSINELNLRISPTTLRDQIQSMEAFQRDGKYDEATLEMVLMQNGFTKERFRAQLEKDLLSMQMLRGLSDTAFALPNEAKRFYRLQNETLSGRFARLAPTSFMPSEAPTAAEIEQYYNENLAQFAVPEQFNLAYLEIDGEALKPQISVTEDELKAYYESNKEQYTGAERRTVAHILFAVDDDTSDAEAKAAAEKAQAELQAGASFAELAQQYSDDIASKEQGGQLEPIEKGFQDPAFDDAVFALSAPEQVSELVRSEFGYHLIKLISVSGGDVQAFDDVKAAIEESVRTTKLYDLFAEKQNILNEKGFETPDSLQEVAAAAGLEVKETGLFPRTSPLSIAREPSVMEAVTTDEVLQQRRNSALIQLSELRAVMVRVKDYQAASHKPLADVQAQITTAINDRKAQKNVADFGAELLSKVQAGEDVGALLAEKNSNWQSFEQITRQAAAPEPMVRQQLFEAARPEEKASISGTTLTDGSYLLVELTAASLPDADALSEEQWQPNKDQLARFSGEAEYMAYVESLKKRAKVTYVDESLAPKS